jgi:hypothetical protein
MRILGATCNDGFESIPLPSNFRSEQLLSTGSQTYRKMDWSLLCRISVTDLLILTVINDCFIHCKE